MEGSPDLIPDGPIPSAYLGVRDNLNLPQYRRLGIGDQVQGQGKPVRERGKHEAMLPRTSVLTVVTS